MQKTADNQHFVLPKHAMNCTEVDNGNPEGSDLVCDPCVPCVRACVRVPIVDSSYCAQSVPIADRTFWVQTALIIYFDDWMISRPAPWKV